MAASAPLYRPLAEVSTSTGEYSQYPAPPPSSDYSSNGSTPTGSESHVASTPPTDSDTAASRFARPVTYARSRYAAAVQANPALRLNFVSAGIAVDAIEEEPNVQQQQPKQSRGRREQHAQSRQSQHSQQQHHQQQPTGSEPLILAPHAQDASQLVIAGFDDDG